MTGQYIVQGIFALAGIVSPAGVIAKLGLVLYNAQRTNHCPECRTQPSTTLLWNTGNYHHWNGYILLCGNTESYRRIICF